MRKRELSWGVVYVVAMSSLALQPRSDEYVCYETETYKSQMYGHNAGQPVSSL